MMPLNNLDPQLIAAKAGKSAPQGANKLVGETPAVPGDFAGMLMQEVGAAEAKSAEAQLGEALVLEEGAVNPEALQNLQTNLPTETLAHSLQPQAGVQAQPVSLEQLNWAMENPAQNLPAATEPTPKVLDPNLIKQVNEVVIPQGAEQVEVQPMQLKDLLMKQEMGMAKMPGRSPAIDFAKAEIDPQLMGFEDFVAQKNAVTGKAVAPNAYGMPAKQSMHVALETDKAVAAAGNAKNPQWSFEAVPSFDMTAQQAQAASQPLYSMEAPLEANRLESAPKVFDMNQLSKVDTSNTDTVISQISDYIVQAKASKEATVHMKVQHQDLGVLDITVNRVQNDVVSIAIGTQDHGAKLFLGQHREQLLTHLTQAGVAVSDLRMEQSSNSSANRDTNQQGQQGFQGGDRQFGSEQNQRRHEQERRQDLWSLLREQEVA